MTLAVAIASNGTITRATFVTKRGIQNPPCDLALRRGILGCRGRPNQAPPGPRNGAGLLGGYLLAALSGGSGDEEEELAQQLPRQDRDHRQVEQAGRRHERPQATGRKGETG